MQPQTSFDFVNACVCVSDAANSARGAAHILDYSGKF
jgi:hypothetical protein